ncbi:unnamed protein product, partial [Amoebophrya sp. A25]
ARWRNVNQDDPFGGYGRNGDVPCVALERFPAVETANRLERHFSQIRERGMETGARLQQKWMKGRTTMGVGESPPPRSLSPVAEVIENKRLAALASPQRSKTSSSDIAAGRGSAGQLERPTSSKAKTKDHQLKTHQAAPKLTSSGTAITAVQPRPRRSASKTPPATSQCPSRRSPSKMNKNAGCSSENIGKKAPSRNARVEKKKGDESNAHLHQQQQPRTRFQLPLPTGDPL